MPAKRRSSPLAASAEQPQAKSRAGQERHDGFRGGEDGMGEFEDNYEDEFESDGEVHDGENEDEDGVEQMDDMEQIGGVDNGDNGQEGDTQAPSAQPYIPHQYKLKPDEILEPDNSVYEMLHTMSVPWPCLSFDLLRDGGGEERRTYPQEMYAATGTQAAGDANEVLVMRWGNLWKTQQNDDSDEEEDDETADETPTLEYKSIAHRGGINRFRVAGVEDNFVPTDPTSMPNRPYLAATWADTGKVHIFNIRPHQLALANPGYMVDKTRDNKPLYTINSHSEEGFALDWSREGASERQLLTGDCAGVIHNSTFTDSGYIPSPAPFTSHTSSVEDLQWSPSERTVFASCSADRSVRVWDTRVRTRTAVVSVLDAHSEDVNVINWNKNTEYLLASGGDEGMVKVWDLRNFKPGTSTAPQPAAQFDWHKGPITGIEWHHKEPSVLAASGADDQVTLWDLAVELDQEELASEVEQLVPPQLMFCHQGQKDIKEVHWHAQVPGCFVSTASDGFNICKTISV
ncbi:hypothetical protein E3P92_00320 [Wallemia ichthyophaga]|nr:hypothetical protein E3P92_00320 [Wallemia ichthyophaga]